MNVDEQIQALQDADFQTGWAIFNSVRTKRAVSQAELLAARNAIANELIFLERNKQAAIVATKETALIDEEFELRQELKLAVHALELVSKKAEQFLLEDAMRQGLTVPNRQQLLVFETSEKIRIASQLELERGQAAIQVGREYHFLDIRIREENEALRRRLLEEDRGSERRIFESHITSQIDTRSHRELREIDIENRWKEIVQDLNAADLVALSDVQLIQKLTEYLTEMSRARYEMAHGDDPDEVKNRLLDRYDKNIIDLEARIDAKQDRLVLSENGEETLRLEEGNPDSGATSSEKTEATEE